MKRTFRKDLSRRLTDALVTAAITRPYFEVPADAPPEAFQAEVAQHPVLKLTPTGSLRT
jgi:hypothetical protein